MLEALLLVTSINVKLRRATGAVMSVVEACCSSDACPMPKVLIEEDVE
jgi:hypothetical protein